MTTLRAAAQQALLVLESGLLVSHSSQVMTALRAALAQQAEPVWVCPESPEHRYKKPGHCEDCGKTLVLAQQDERVGRSRRNPCKGEHMTDRELLKLAAKAAGLNGFLVDAGLNIGSNAAPKIWNPITDDGDALRLAVKLAINFKIMNGVTWWDRQESDGVVYWGHEPHRDDPLAATRRAIVGAAAEIGKNSTRGNK